MKIAITGHRPNKLGNDYDLTSPLVQEIREKIEDSLHQIPAFLDRKAIFIIGMALGIDTLFAKIAIEYNIPFIAAIPFIGQENKWPTKSQNTYREILKKAMHIEVICDSGYSVDKMQKRNIWMVDNADILIAVWDGSSGGTANCVKYADKKYADNKNKQVIYINPKEL